MTGRGKSSESRAILSTVSGSLRTSDVGKTYWLVSSYRVLKRVNYEPMSFKVTGGRFFRLWLSGA